MAFLKHELITVAEVHTEVIPDVNFDTTLLTRYVFLAQTRYLKPLLGDDFYEELVSESNGATLTADNTAILDDWIKPMLAYFIMYLSLPQIRNEITEVGIMNNRSETSDASSNSDYASLRASMLDNGQTWVNNIKEFIKQAQEDDTTKYPLYCSSESQFGTNNIIFY